MEKKSKELECLKQAIALGLHKRGKTKEFFRAIEAGLKDKEAILDGERPDFIMFAPQKNSGKKTVIGIEHFRVDHIVTKKQPKTSGGGNQVASIGVVEQKNVNAFYDKYHEAVMNSEEIPEGLFEGLSQLLESMTNNIQKATYRNFMESFTYSMQKHLESAVDYRHTLEKVSDGAYDTKLGFLVEVHSDFGHLYLSHKGKIQKAKNGLMPIFDEIVQWVEDSFSTRKVDFIILYLSETLETGNHDVVFSPIRNLRTNLQKQGVRIFHYAGDDMNLNPFEPNHRDSVAKVTCQKEDEEKFSVELSVTETPREDKIERLQLSSKRALEYEERNEDYALTSGVLFTMMLLRDNVITWRKSRIRDEKWFYPTVVDGSPEFLKNRAEEYMNRWGENNDE